MLPKSISITGFWLWFSLFVMVYNLSWVINPGRSLSLGAYDLAEWSSLHPAVKATTPPLLTSFLLRFPLVGLAWITGFNSKGFTTKSLRLFHAIIVILTAISLLPPLEFFTLASNDPNYQQQFLLSVAALVGGMIGLSGLLNSVRLVIVLTINIGIACASTLSLSQSYALMREIRIPTHIGIGGVGLITLCAIVSLILALNLVKQTR